MGRARPQAPSLLLGTRSVVAKFMVLLTEAIRSDTWLCHFDIDIYLLISDGYLIFDI
jgi:hypothetical protein